MNGSTASVTMKGIRKMSMNRTQADPRISKYGFRGSGDVEFHIYIMTFLRLKYCLGP